MMGSTTVVVWGASGFIGSAVISKLITMGIKVRGVSRREFPASDSWGGAYTHHQLDVRATKEAWLKVLSGADCVVHCAGHYDNKANPQDDFEHSSSILSQAVIEGGLRRFIFISSIAVYGPRLGGQITVSDPLNPHTNYGRSRARAESTTREIFENSSAQLLILRVPAVVGVGMRGRVLRRLFKSLNSGLFFHPGRKNSSFPCVGISRLSAFVADLAANLELCSDQTVVQLVDNIGWINLVKRYQKMSKKPFIRLRIPGVFLVSLMRWLQLNPPTALVALASEAKYETSPSWANTPERYPSTLSDIEAEISRISTCMSSKIHLRDR
jgi:nucleoside-diphosphate-sugar epimerase